MSLRGRTSHCQLGIRQRGIASVCLLATLLLGTFSFANLAASELADPTNCPKSIAVDRQERERDERRAKAKVRLAIEEQQRELERRQEIADELLALSPEPLRGGDDFRAPGENRGVIVGLDPPYDHTAFVIQDLYVGDLKNTVPDFPDAAEKYGIKYFPPSIDRIGFLNLERIRQNENRKYDPGSSKHVKEICRLTGKQYEELDWITTGEALDGFSSLGNPVLMIVKSNSKFSFESDELEKLHARKFGKDEIRYTEAGRAIAIIDPQTIAIGTANEVLFAKRKYGLRGRHAGFEWLDYSKYDAVSGSVSRYGGRVSTKKFRASQGDSILELDYVGHEGWASVLAHEEKTRLAMARKERSVFSYLAEVTRVLATVGKVPNWSPDYPVYLEAYMRKVDQAPRKFPLAPKELDVRSEGRVKIRELKISGKGKLKNQDRSAANAVFGAPVSNDKNLVADVLGSYSGLGDRVEDEYDAALAAHQRLNSAFEGLRFQNPFERQRIQERTALAAKGLLGGPQKHLDPDAVKKDLVAALDNTSSAFVRSEIIRSIVANKSPVAIHIMAAEARKRELFAKFATDPTEDDPHRDYQRGAFRRSDRPDDELIELAGYYLQFGASADLVRDSCQVLRALAGARGRRQLESYFQARHPTDAQREYVAQCVADFVIEEPYIKPESFEQTVKWLNSSNRSKKYSALTALLDEDFLKDKNREVMQAAVILLDDSLLHELATEVFKRRLQGSELDVLQAVVEACLYDANYRSRQNYSVHRVVELMAELGDVEGLAKASLIVDKDLFLKILSYLHVNQLDKTPVLRAQLDEVSAGRFVNERVELLSRFSFLDADQKQLIRTWAEEHFEDALANPVAVKALTNTKTVTKEMVPELISIWANKEHSVAEIARYLKQCGPGIEHLVVDAIEDALDDGVQYSVYEVASIFEKIGTLHCILTIRRALKLDSNFNDGPQGERMRERIQQSIDKIADPRREPIDFEDWDPETWFKS